MEERRGKEKKEDLELLRRRVKRFAEVLEKDNPAAFEVGSQLGLVLTAALPYCEEFTLWCFAKEVAAIKRTASGRCRACGDKVEELDSALWKNETCPACREEWNKQAAEWEKEAEDFNPEA